MKKQFYKNHLIKKKLGQVFLEDQHVINTIIDSIQLKKQQNVVEIGPGFGALTKQIIQFVDQLTIIEIDKNLSKWLKNNLFIKKKIKIIQKNVIEINFKKLSNKIGKPIRIIGNLPYNFSINIIFHLFKYSDVIQDMHFMLQKEVAERLTAIPNNKHYGKLSILSQYHCKIKKILEVESTSFLPKPKVNSTVVKLIPYHADDNPYPITDIKKLNFISKTAFNQRRKTIKNSLSEIFTQKKLEKQGINLKLRPENLNIEQFCHLANTIHK